MLPTTARHLSSCISASKLSPALTQVVLNRPSKMNALNMEMTRDLAQALAELPSDSCLLMEGAGERAFCAGGDVAVIREEVLKGHLVSGLPADFFFEEYHINYWLSVLQRERRITQVSLWNGVVMGGGVGLSVHGPVRVATEKSLFAMPEVSIGFFPDVGATHVLPRIRAGKEVGLYLALTGARMGASDLMWSGLATHYVPSDRLDVLRSELVKRSSSSKDVEHALQVARDGAEVPLPSKGKTIESLFSDEIRACFAQTSVEGILASLGALGTEDAKQAVQSIRVASPLSVRIGFEALQRNGKPKVTLKQALATEFRISQHSLTKSDFCEGVRAVLVEKGKPAVWRFPKVEDVPSVDEFFEPLPANHSRGEFLAELKTVFPSSAAATAEAGL